MKKSIIFLAAFLIFSGIVFAADHNINSCRLGGNWISGDTYYLTQDITDFTGTVDRCMDIDADDATLDCQWHAIKGDGNIMGIVLNGVSGVTVKNCILNSLQNGLVLIDATESTLINIKADNNNLEGILKDVSSDYNDFQCVRACNNHLENPDSFDIKDEGNDNTWFFTICDDDDPSGICISSCRTCESDDGCYEGEECNNDYCFIKCGDGPPPPIPEFSTVGMIVALLAVAVASLWIMKRRK